MNDIRDTTACTQYTLFYIMIAALSTYNFIWLQNLEKSTKGTKKDNWRISKWLSEGLGFLQWRSCLSLQKSVWELKNTFKKKRTQVTHQNVHMRFFHKAEHKSTTVFEDINALLLLARLIDRKSVTLRITLRIYLCRCLAWHLAEICIYLCF